MLNHLPDIVIYRLCDFLDLKSLTNLKDVDWRVNHYRRFIRVNAVHVIIHHWRSFKMCGRVYLECNLTRLNTFVQLGYMPMQYRYYDFIHHTVFPRNRIVIPRSLFRYTLKHGYHTIVSMLGGFIYDIRTYPSVPINLYVNDVFENITPDAMIPTFNLITSTIIIGINPDYPKPSYLCYTEIAMTNKKTDFYFNKRLCFFRNIDNLNFNASYENNTLVKKSNFIPRYRNLFPV